MIKYQYKAINKEGQPFSENMVAESVNIVAEKLKSIGLTIIFIKESRSKNALGAFFFEKLIKSNLQN